MLSTEHLYTARQTAEILNVRQDTLRRWVAAGLIPVVRLSGRWLRFRPFDIEAFIGARLVEASQ